VPTKTSTRKGLAEMRQLGATPQVAQNTACSGGTSIDRRTTSAVTEFSSIREPEGQDCPDYP
jgi:hypothetical protein